MSDEKYDILLKLVKGTFNVPPKQRTKQRTIQEKNNIRHFQSQHM